MYNKSFDRTEGVKSHPSVPEYKTLGPDSPNCFIERQAADTETDQNVKFLDSPEETAYSTIGEFDRTRTAADSRVPIQKFWERPVRILSTQWDVNSTGFFVDIDPWFAVFSDSRVVNRMSNFKNFRGNLHVKFVLNGTGFHFGRLLASYVPMPNEDKITKNRALVAKDLIAASQRPHLYLDPCNSQGGTMDLSFLWYYDNIDLTVSENTAIGLLNIRELTPLKHANGATDPVTLTVFAWFSDVVLSQPTELDMNGLVAQAEDEYGSVSGPASVVERISGKLASAPIIGPYARASQIASGAVKNIAKSFGYCKPANIEPEQPYVPRYLGNMSSIEGTDSSVKLSLDPKQELSVDPRIMSTTLDDEMSFVNIAKRESYITSFPWNVGTAPDTLLFEASVSPMMYDSLSSVDELTEYHMTPSAWVMSAFNFWKGSMRYRFQLVTSNYHKGRLRVVYDPGDPFNADSFNLAFSQIVDISQENDFSVEIGWASYAGMLRVRDPYVQALLPFSIPGGPPLDYQRSNHNGTIKVYILNELTTPNTLADNDISINVFSAACDDFVVSSPRAGIIEKLGIFQAAAPPPEAISELERQSQVDSETTTEPSAPMQSASQALVMNKEESSVTDPLLHVYGGESVTSVRALLKRYCLHSCSVFRPTGYTWYTNTTLNSDFPYYRGASIYGVNTADGQPYNRCKMTLLNWFTPGFCCFRGGIRRKAVRAASRLSQGFQTVIRNSDIFNNEVSAGQSFLTGSAADFQTQITNALFTTIPGAHSQPITNNPVLEFELPQYTNRRFMLGRNVYIEKFNAAASYHAVQELNLSDGSSQQPNVITVNYVAAADDFSLGYFLSVPVFFGLGNIDPLT